MKYKYSTRSSTFYRSAIRELLKFTTMPDLVYFAGGLPDPTLFPVSIITESAQEVLENEHFSALQYGTTEGDIRLKREIVMRMKKVEKLDVKEEELLITAASQQALDLLSKIFIDEGDIIFVELPSYLGGLLSFNSYGARMIGIQMDDNGMIVDILKKKYKKLTKEEKNKVKFVYTVPDFQNPAGVTLSLERREELVDFAEENDLLIVEDTPYRELRYEGEFIPSLFFLSPRGRVVSLYTFSKIFCPGFRLGYILAPEEIINKLVTAKQAVDLCTPPFTQAILYHAMKMGVFEKHIEKLINVYRGKRNFMIQKLDEYMLPLQIKELRWTRPNGGLFLWMVLPQYMDAKELLNLAIEKKVAYVPGEQFHCDGSGHNTLRINFSCPNYDEIEKGVLRLSMVINSAKR